MSLTHRCRFSLLRFDEQFNEFVESRLGSFIDLVGFDRADGMLHDQHRMIRRSEGLFFRFCQRLKGMGDQSHGKPAALL